MGIIVLLIAISVAIALLFLGIFYWNIKSGQYDDTYTPSVRMLFDDKPKNNRLQEDKSCLLVDIKTKQSSENEIVNMESEHKSQPMNGEL